MDVNGNSTLERARTGAIMNGVQLASDQEASLPMAKRMKQSDNDGAVSPREASVPKRREIIEEDGEAKNTKPNDRKTAPPDTAAAPCKPHNDLDAQIDPSSTTNLATRPPKAHRIKRHKKLSSNHAISGTDRSPKRRRHSGSHRHSAKSDGVKLSDSLRGFCTLPHSGRTAGKARKRVISSSSDSTHVEDTSLKHHPSKRSSQTTSVRTRWHTKGLCRVVKKALAPATASTSKKRKRSARQPSSTRGESRRKTLRTVSWHVETRSTKYQRIAIKPHATFRHRSMLRRFLARRRVLHGLVSVRVHPRVCQLKMIMRQWRK